MRGFFAELIGTMLVVFAGCSSAVLMGANVGTFGIAFAFGMATAAMYVVLCGISGAQLNPAVSLAMLITARTTPQRAMRNIAAQILGAFFGAATLAFIINSTVLSDYKVTGLLENFYAEAGPLNLSAMGAFAAEFFLTFIFILVYLAVKREGGDVKLGALTIGFTLTAVYLVAIPLTNGGINPAKSIATAALMGSYAASQLWVFVLAPLAGAAAAAVVFDLFYKIKD